MEKRIIVILSALIFALTVPVAAFEETQSGTNAIWSFHVSFDLAPKQLSDVFKERFFVSQHFSIFVADGRIIASTGSYNPHLSKQFGPWKIFSFISTNDQHALFTNICNLVKSGQGVTSSDDLPDYYDAGDPAFTIGVQIDGDDRYFRCKLSGKESVSSCQVRHVMALLRRNLPASFEKLFEYLHVAKLPPLDLKSDPFGRCDVHKEGLKTGSVPVSYGFIIQNDTYLKAESKLFPHANTTAPGGCVISPGNETSRMTLYCGSCREAKKRWMKENTLQQRDPSNPLTPSAQGADGR